MAPHPFTTIDPNVGYCLLPAPAGSCPEDDYDYDDHGEEGKGEGGRGGIRDVVGGGGGIRTFALTHGRDLEGRRFLPATLKDVAGLVPGAYRGRGKGNKVRKGRIGGERRGRGRFFFFSPPSLPPACLLVRRVWCVASSREGGVLVGLLRAVIYSSSSSTFSPPVS